MSAGAAVGLLLLCAGAVARADASGPTPPPGAASGAAVSLPVEETAGVADAAGYPEDGLVFFPAGPARGRQRWAVGGVWQIAPMFAANWRRGLGSGLSVDARLQAVGVYNQLGLGGAWGAPVGPFHLAATAHLDAWYGLLGKLFVDSGTSGFSGSGWGVLAEPGAKVGLQVASDSWLTLLVEVILQPYQSQDLGGLVITPSSAPLRAGGMASLVVEHAPGKGVLYYGATLYNTAENFPLWFNVDYSSQKFWYLGFLAGYEF